MNQYEITNFERPDWDYPDYDDLYGEDPEDYSDEITDW